MILILNMVAWSRQGPIPKAKYAKSEIHTAAQRLKEKAYENGDYRTEIIR